MRRHRHSECERSYLAYESALMTFADEAASSPSRQSNVSLSRAQKGALVSRTRDCPSEYDCLFLPNRAACFSARKLFCGTWFAEGGGHFIPLYAPLQVAALIKNFALRCHHRSCRDGVTLACFLVSRGVVILFVISNTQCAGRFFGMGGHAFRQEN
jgi:hypothetical protein